MESRETETKVDKNKSHHQHIMYSKLQWMLIIFTGRVWGEKANDKISEYKIVILPLIL